MFSARRPIAAGLAALVLALALTPVSETASAHPSHPATTVLLPGFNLAGWIEPEAGVAELFEVLPELKAVYAWDAAEQRYRSSSGPGAGDLTTLMPGMGLWLDIAGDEPVPWTRSAAPDPGASLITLREGWNLVAWSGADRVTFSEAFGRLEGDLESVLSWDDESGWFASYVPFGEPVLNDDRLLSHGDAFLLNLSGERRWLQRGGVEPRVEFYGDFSAERKAEIRIETLSVMTWFAERYGLLEPDFKLFLGADADSLIQAQREVLGIRDPSSVLCGLAVDELVFLADWCATATHDLTSAIAHEYFHVLQTHLVARAAPEATVYVAGWLLEGTAEHMGIAYSISRGFTAVEDVEQSFLNLVTYNRPALQDFEENISELDTGGYLLAALAVQQLVQPYGDEAIIEFFKVLPASADWRAAFERTFGRSSVEFYAELSEYMVTTAPELRNVHVTILGPDGEPVWQWHDNPLRLTVGRWDPETRTTDDSTPGARMDQAGATLRLPDGDYVLSASATCVFRSGEFYNSALSVTIAWYTPGDDPRDGDPRRVGGQPVLRVEGEDRTVVIRLAASPGELNINCYDGPRYRISGRLVDEAGRGLQRYEILAYPDTGDPASIPLYWNYTDETSTFSIEAPDGYAYRLTVLDSCGSLVGVYHEDEGLVRYGDNGWERASMVDVDGADVSGIDVVIPASFELDGDC